MHYARAQVIVWGMFNMSQVPAGGAKDRIKKGQKDKRPFVESINSMDIRD
jgi:hypothetical protein